MNDHAALKLTIIRVDIRYACDLKITKVLEILRISLEREIQMQLSISPVSSSFIFSLLTHLLSDVVYTLFQTTGKSLKVLGNTREVIVGIVGKEMA